MKVYVISDIIKNGLQTMEGYIEYTTKDEIIYTNYFKLQYDNSTNDYDYSGSDITEEQEELLHDIIINNKYEMPKDEESIYKYLDCAIMTNGSYYTNKIKEVNLNGRKLKLWKNTKGFIHFITQTIENFTDGKRHLCNTEFTFDKNKHLKELKSNIIFK